MTERFRLEHAASDGDSFSAVDTPSPEFLRHAALADLDMESPGPRVDPSRMAVSDMVPSGNVEPEVAGHGQAGADEHMGLHANPNTTERSNQRTVGEQKRRPRGPDRCAREWRYLYKANDTATRCTPTSRTSLGTSRVVSRRRTQCKDHQHGSSCPRTT